MLDPCDAEAVYDFKRDNSKVKDRSAARRSSVLRMNTQSSIQASFVEKSGDRGQKTPSMKQNATFDNNPSFGMDMDDPSSCPGSPEFEFPDINDNDNDDDDDDGDPWKPLNPHEAGNLRIRPFKRCMSILFSNPDDLSAVYLLI